MNNAISPNSNEAEISYGIAAVGRLPLEKHNEGKRLTYKQAVLAKCYECMAGYVDGKFDCRISDCPLHSYMPYRGKDPSEEVGNSDKEGLEGVIVDNE